jgi:hypothetical protein
MLLQKDMTGAVLADRILALPTASAGAGYWRRARWRGGRGRMIVDRALEIAGRRSAIGDR